MLTKSQSIANARVARGAALLDKRSPGWHNAIDTERVDSSHGLVWAEEDAACVLTLLDHAKKRKSKEPGHRVGDWFKGAKDVGVEPFSRYAVSVGFIPSSTGRNAAVSCIELDAAWKFEVMERQEQEVAR